MRSFAFFVPGALDQLTGGHIYARRIVAGLRTRGVAVSVYELPGRFPEGGEAARRAAARALASLPDGTIVLLDGLALAAFEDGIVRDAARLGLLALVHHPLPQETGLAPSEIARLGALERRLLPLFRGVLCPSARTAAAVAAYGVAQIAIVPPGTMKPAKPVARVARVPLRLLSIGTLTPRKGQALLVEALARIAARPWHLDIIGSLTRDPVTADAVRAAIARAGLEERIRLLGERPQERLSDAYEAADLFVLASYHEGYGMAFAEALAWGLPIVATSGGAIPETVPESAGLLVPPGDAAALAHALERVIEDGALRGRLAAGAAAAGARLPSWDETVERFHAAATRLLQ